MSGYMQPMRPSQLSYLQDWKACHKICQAGILMPYLLASGHVRLRSMHAQWMQHSFARCDTSFFHLLGTHDRTF